MKRREALKRSGWILQSSLFTPAVLQALSSCRESNLPETDLLVLDDEQHQLVNAIADIIIPATQSPSASEVKVNRILDLLLRDVFEPETVEEFLTGLAEFNDECQAISGSYFTELKSQDQLKYLEVLDERIMGRSYQQQVPFYFGFKSLVTRIYFSTEQGLKQNLNYQPVPGPYQGVVPWDPSQPISVGNHL